MSTSTPCRLGDGAYAVCVSVKRPLSPTFASVCSSAFVPVCGLAEDSSQTAYHQLISSRNADGSAEPHLAMQAGVHNACTS